MSEGRPGSVGGFFGGCRNFRTLSAMTVLGRPVLVPDGRYLGPLAKL
jgi:hypothetical protein